MKDLKYQMDSFVGAMPHDDSVFMQTQMMKDKLKSLESTMTKKT